MYNAFQLVFKYAKYYLQAANGRGHGTHSPFVFNFVHNVLNDATPYACYAPIEASRQQLLQRNESILVQDFGAGSSVNKSSKKIIGRVARASLKPKKYAQLIFRIANYYNIKTAVELGTSFGITTAYLSNATADGKVFSLEGSASIAQIAKEQLGKLSIGNTEIIVGNFDDTLPGLLRQVTVLDFVFIDGNHRELPTIAYFNACLQHAHNDTIFIFDDIYWSKEMEAAWENIKCHPAVTLTIDLFFIGMVKISKQFLQKQHHVIRF